MERNDVFYDYSNGPAICAACFEKLDEGEKLQLGSYPAEQTNGGECDTCGELLIKEECR